MKKIFATILTVGFLCVGHVQAETRFDAISFDPAIEGGDFFTVHDATTLKAWQGHFGLYFDYANRPLQFTGQGSLAGQRQSIIDHMVVANPMGALSLTDWMMVGVNIPVVIHNWYYSDNPTTDPTGDQDFGSDMADIELMMKFRLLQPGKGKVGLAFIPHMTLPTGNPEKYTGNGVITGGGTLAMDYQPTNRLRFGLNVGAIFREGFSRTYTFNLGGGSVATDTISLNDIATFGAALNYKVTKQFQAILETHGSTDIENFFEKRSTPIEAGGGVRYYFGDTGFALSGGGTVGLLDGIGKPRYRAFFGINWYSPEPKPCPVCKEVAPQIIKQKVYIEKDRLVLWSKIFFDTDKATIKSVSYPVLDDVADVIKATKDIKLVEVQGHTDWRASDSYNQKLSQRRAESAVKYLVNKGIDPSRLRAVGYGESKPIASNKTAEGMSQNRRTEFIIVETYSGKKIDSYQPTTSLETTAPVESVEIEGSAEDSEEAENVVDKENTVDEDESDAEETSSDDESVNTNNATVTTTTETTEQGTVISKSEEVIDGKKVEVQIVEVDS